MYNHGIVYILQAAFLSALYSELLVSDKTFLELSVLVKIGLNL